MKFSYRHPDIAAKEAQRSKVLEKEAEALLERRRVIRSIPISAAIESTDEESWHLWDKAEFERKAD
jgi:hypothetical protein